MEDLEAFLSPEQAQEAFDMLDSNGDGKLVLADIRDAVIKIYKERRNLALSLKVCNTLVGQSCLCLSWHSAAKAFICHMSKHVLLALAGLQLWTLAGCMHGLFSADPKVFKSSSSLSGFAGFSLLSSMFNKWFCFLERLELD